VVRQVYLPSVAQENRHFISLWAESYDAGGVSIQHTGPGRIDLLPKVGSADAGIRRGRLLTARDARTFMQASATESINVPQGLDSIDIKILDHLQKDASLSTAELAERVGLSQSPCWRRIQRMRDEGYIQSQVAILDRQKLGFHMQIFALVKMTTLTEEKRAEFVKAIRNTPEILECYTVFGEMDVMLKVLVPDVNWYQEFIFSTILKLPGVVDVRSTVTLQQTKFHHSDTPSAPQAEIGFSVRT
jgi:Lrp/AsnC family transcriptional regulator